LTVEGLPYGYHNFLFSWLDTKNDNWPPFMPRYIGVVAFGLLEHIIPSVITQFIGEALNIRLGT
jgi:hypothetical protein